MAGPLKREGYVVEKLTDGAAALAAIERAVSGLVLSRVLMPGDGNYIGTVTSSRFGQPTTAASNAGFRSGSDLIFSRVAKRVIGIEFE